LGDGKRVACVLINATKQPVTVHIAVAGRASTKLSQFVTDETRDLAKVEPQGDDNIVLPPRSVSTLVIE
jgi:O-glycosyl hydrolase